MKRLFPASVLSATSMVAIFASGLAVGSFLLPQSSAASPAAITAVSYAGDVPAWRHPPPTTTTTTRPPVPKPVPKAAARAPVYRHVYRPVSNRAPNPVYAGAGCYGITDPNALAIIARESGCNVYARNPSGACGIGQRMGRCDGYNGGAQAADMTQYVMGRYGSWAAAEAHERQYGWY